MSDIKAGVVVVTKFTTPGSKEFASYINYIDREKAVRNENASKYILDDLKSESELKGYIDYMDNPEKTSELFTADKNKLSDDDKQILKNTFETAEKNGSVMWQTVISFDNAFLEKQGIYNSETKELDENKLKTCCRGCMAKMLEKEKLNDTAVWSGAIHYNTDNIHIHIATVEPVPTREVIKEGKFKGQVRGKFKQSSIDAGKSFVVNEITQNKELNQRINNIIRHNIVGVAKENNLLRADKEIASKLLKLYNKLPADRRLWKYNMNALAGLRPAIDDITNTYLDNFAGQEFQELNNALDTQSNIYQEAYGNNYRNFKDGKLNELYTQMGNTILNELKGYDKEIKNNMANQSKKKKYKNPPTKVKNINEMQQLNILKSRMKKLKRLLNNDVQHQRNMAIYQQEFEQEM